MLPAEMFVFVVSFLLSDIIVITKLIFAKKLLPTHNKPCSEVTSAQTMPDKRSLWSDHPRPKYHLIGLKCSRNTVCAPSALKNVSDQTFPDGNDLWSERKQTIVKTFVRARPWPKADYHPDNCASKQPLIRQSPDQNCHWSDLFINIVIRYASIFSRPLSRRLYAWSDVWSDHAQTRDSDCRRKAHLTRLLSVQKPLLIRLLSN